MASIHPRVFEEVVALSTQGLLIVNAARPEPVIVHANPAWLERSGYSLEELKGTDWLTLIGLGDPSPQMVEIRNCLSAGTATDLQVPYFHRDGELWTASLHLSPIGLKNSSQSLWLVQHASERRSAPGEGENSNRIAAGAHPATGLLSRTQFEMHCRRKLGVARREHSSLCLMLWSVPELEIYRETFGPKAADSCLRMIATQITGTFRRGSDLCALFDRSTLAIVITGLDQQQADMRVTGVEHKVRNLALHNPHGRLSRYVAVRGTAVQAVDGESIESLLARVDEVMTSGASVASRSLAACV